MERKQGTVIVSEEALGVALDFVRLQKEATIDAGDFNAAANWRDDERQLVTALYTDGQLPAPWNTTSLPSGERDLSSERWQAFVRQSGSGALYLFP